MNKKQRQKQEKLKMLLVSQILSIVGVLSVLALTLTFLWRIFVCGNLIRIGSNNCSDIPAFATMAGSIDFTVTLGTIGLIGIVAGAITRSLLKD